MAFPHLDYKLFYITVIVVHLCICAVGYIGNIITCIVIASNKSMYTAVNVYLFNLAVADLMMLSVGLTKLTVPYWYRSQGKAKELERCDIQNAILNTAFHVSIMTITAFTIERYLAICQPFFARRILSISKAVKLIFFIWIIGSVCGYAIGSQFIEEYYTKTDFICYGNDTVPYLVYAQLFIFFILPFILLMVLNVLIERMLARTCKIQKNKGSFKNGESSSESRNHDDSKIFKMLLTVIAVFFATWAPYHIGRFLNWNINFAHFLLQRFNTHDFVLVQTIIDAISSTAYFISASANPVIYSAMSNKFRDAFKGLIKHWLGVRKQDKKMENNQESIETSI